MLVKIHDNNYHYPVQKLVSVSVQKTGWLALENYAPPFFALQFALLPLQYFPSASKALKSNPEPCSGQFSNKPFSGVQTTACYLSNLCALVSYQQPPVTHNPAASPKSSHRGETLQILNNIPAMTHHSHGILTTQLCFSFFQKYGSHSLIHQHQPDFSQCYLCVYETHLLQMFHNNKPWSEGIMPSEVLEVFQCETDGRSVFINSKRQQQQINTVNGGRSGNRQASH